MRIHPHLYVFAGALAAATASVLISVTGRACAATNASACPTPVYPDIFVGQSAAGSGDGSSCANQEPATFFNSAGNWGVGNPIAPGKIVGLCGTITSTLTAQGSGTSGAPITVYWKPGAKLSQAVCDASTGCFNTNSKTDLVLNGGTNGIVEDTANGTNLANQLNSIGVVATGCDRCTIENLTVQNIYVHVGLADHAIDQTAVNSIKADGNNLAIHDNTLHDAGWSIYTNSICNDTMRVYGNNIYNIDHGWALGQANTACAHATAFFNNNHVHDTVNWDTTANQYHHDGIHCYTSGTSGVAMHIDNFYIYNNTFDGDWGDHHTTAHVFLEGGTGGGSTPCNDAASHVWVFNNVMTPSAGVIANPILSDYFGHVFAANNTIDGVDPTDTQSTCVQIISSGTYENNALGGCNQIITTGNTALSPVPTTMDYNAYAHCTGSFNCFALSTSGNWTANFATYQSRFPTLDVHGVANLSAATGSNATGVGTNLTSTCVGALVSLCTTIDGVARPTSGAWNAGAH